LNSLKISIVYQRVLLTSAILHKGCLVYKKFTIFIYDSLKYFRRSILENIDKLSLEELIDLKNKFLKEYKALEFDLEYAQDDFEKNMIEDKRKKLVKKIKELAGKIKDIENIGDKNEKI
jgi:hypothetical protein